MKLLWILASAFAISLLGFAGVMFFGIKKKKLDKITESLVSFAAGALLGGAFFHLIPESVEMSGGVAAMGYVLIGFVVFLLIEGYFHWHLCESCKTHPFTYTMLIGDAVHNMIDGFVVAAAFIASTTLGLVTSLVIIGHELPQQIGLFGALVYGGHEKKKAVFYSFIAQSTIIVGAIIGYFAAKASESIVPFLVAFAGGGFVYIASSDLIPEMHRMYRGNASKTAKVLFSFAAGILLMILFKIAFE